MLTPKLRMNGLGSVDGSQQKVPTGDQILRALSGSRKKSIQRTSRGCLRKKAKRRGSYPRSRLWRSSSRSVPSSLLQILHREKRLVVVPSYTDNRGNGALLNKLMSCKFPALSAPDGVWGAAKIFRSSAGRKVGTQGDELWRADRLANGDTSGFDPLLRLRVLPPTGGWFILDEALRLGEAAEIEKKRYRAEGGLRRQVKGKREEA